FSSNFPRKNEYSFGSYPIGGTGLADAFVSKLGPFGSNVLYSTYFGADGSDGANGIAVDNGGNAYVAGYTYSIGTGNTPFPTAPNTAYQRNNKGGRDAFIAKLNTASSGSGSLVYSTFLGGSSDETANAIAIDSAGNAYITGEIDSYAQFPANKPPI